ncbi:MAG: amidohydrolase family protein [candidate division WOR-3 bacterium]|nr:MAG: amidohydrolase family protein [candidate division WOR-3 bacterium]
MELTGLTISSPQAKPAPLRIVSSEGRIAALEPVAVSPSMPFVCAGFIDSHLHPLELGLQEIFVNLHGAGSLDHVLTGIRSWIGENPDSPLCLGFNLRPELLKENRYPTCAELDAVTGRTPTLVYRIDGHSAALNTPGLELGLKHGKLPGVDLDQSGRHTGVVRGRAYEHASRVFKHRLSTDILRRALHKASDKALARGVTTVAAMVGDRDLAEPDWQLLLGALADLDARAVPFCQTRDSGLAGKLGLSRVGGCILIDGSFGSHTAAVNQDYSDAPGNRGVLYFEDRELAALLARAHQLGLQTAFHAIGDRAVEQLVRTHEQCDTCKGGNPLRHRIEHAELLSPELVARIAALGVVLGVQPAFESCWGGPQGMYAARIGERWRKTNPYRSLLDAGVVLAGGSDAPITPIDPLAGIRSAVNHPNPDQRISGTQAFAMFTTAAAFSLGLETSCGRVEPGYDADLAVLSADPRTGADCRVLATFRGGRRVFESAPQTTSQWLT